MDRKKTCPVCGSSDVSPFFALSNIPVANNVVCRTYADAIQFPTGDLKFVLCEKCSFAWNAAYNADLLQYNEEYENNQSLSSVFLEHVDSIIDHMPLGEKPTYLVEVGCGQGYFLKRLQQKLGARIAGAMGFDPALRAENESGALRRGVLDRRQFPENFLPTLFISRHVIEHIENVVPFMEDVCSNLPLATCGILETPSLEWIVNHRAYYDMYYEHCSLFTEKSITFLLKKFGFAECKVTFLFGGQYMLAVGRKDAAPQEGAGEGAAVKDIHDFSRGFAAYAKKWARRVGELKDKYKKVGIWGGASKGVNFLHHMRAQDVALDCVVDINPQKQGGFIPGCGTPIVSPESAWDAGVRAFVVTNPNYLGEIKKMCQEGKVEAVLIPLE